MKIAVVGLGRMGIQIVRKLIDSGYEVVVYDRGKYPINEAVSHGAVAAYTKQEVIKAFDGKQFVLWLMIPSDVVGDELTEWLSLMPKGSTIIDGGNSDFRLTQKRAEQVQAAGLFLLDCGTSGGVWGYQNGFSMMIGGPQASYQAVEPVFKTLSLPTGAYHYFGESGAGHYVKMVHNAIEYGMMESLAEGYRLLEDGPIKNLDLAAIGEVWQHGSVVTSWLNELSRQALAESPKLTEVNGQVAESGEARWALETAQALEIEMPAIQASFDVRLASQQGKINFATKLLSAMRNKFGGHPINK